MKKKGLVAKISLLMKYNKLKLKLESKQEEYDKKVLELYTERKLHKREKEIWEEALKEQEQEIIRLKKRGVKGDTKATTTRVSRKK